DKQSPRLHNNFALVALRRGEIGLAASHFTKAVEVDAHNYAARINLGAMFLDNLDFSGAERHFAAALAVEPRSLEATLGLGNARYGGKRWKEATQAFDAALKIDGNNAQALVALGRIYHERLNEAQKALGYFQRYLARGNVPANDV